MLVLTHLVCILMYASKDCYMSLSTEVVNGQQDRQSGCINMHMHCKATLTGPLSQWPGLDV